MNDFLRNYRKVLIATLTYLFVTFILPETPLFDLIVTLIRNYIPISILASTINLLFYLIILIVFIILYKNEIINLYENLFENLFEKIRILGISMLIITLTNIAYKFMANHFGIPATSQNQQGITSLFSDKFSVIIITLTVIFIGPLIEEIIFRYIIFNYLRKLIDINWAIIASAFIFGLVHINHALFSGHFTEFFAIVPYFVIGYLLAYWNYRTDNNTTSLFLHMLLNTISALFTIL